MTLCYDSIQEAGKHLIEVSAFLRKQRIFWSCEHQSWMFFDLSLAGSIPRKITDERLFEIYAHFFGEKIPRGMLVWSTGVLREMM